MPFKECEAKKEPCKRPPGKCDKKEEKKKEKCPDMPKKKCSNWTSAYGFWNAKENILPTVSWQDLASDPMENDLKCGGCSKFPYDKNQADYDKVSKRKCQNKKNPKCQRKKRKTVPDSCTSDDCGKHCICHNSPFIIFELGKNCKESNSKEKCPISERKCPVVDNTVDIEKDMLNYWECKLVGANPRLKLDVVPHKFACQKSERSLVAERPYAAKRRRLEVIQEAFEWREAQQQSDECRASTSFQKPEENVQLREFEAFKRHETQLLSHECIPSTSFQKAEENVELHEFDEQSETASKSIQVNIHSHYRSKSTMTSRHCTSKNVSLSPIKAKMIDESTSPIKIKSSINIFSSSDSASLSISTDDSFIADSVEESSNCSFDEEISKESFDGKIRECTLMAIEKNSRLFLGIPENSYHLIDLLSQNIPCRLLNVLITLKKIRLDDSFAVLAVHFGMSLSNISRIFKNTMPVMALQLEKLLYWPKPEQIRLHLPVPFRARYDKVVSIIDCLELQIEKPSDPVHQALSWSQYKSCNTIKYLISCTPDGLVNFISCGYGGRATDALIVEDCNYLDNLDPGLSVMADRGFKNIAHLLKQRGCELIRPPSVSKDIASTKEEVKSEKRIAALRIHVERVIGRLREFKMLLPHACIDNHMIQYMDYVIKIACGIINLQGHLINIQM